MADRAKLEYAAWADPPQDGRYGDLWRRLMSSCGRIPAER